MADSWRDVLNGEARWSCEAADAVVFFAGLPDDSVDLLCCSPPYMRARTYGRDDVSRDCDEWVAWMVEVVKAAAPKVKGLIAINCEGQTREYRYAPAPFLLMADLHRDGFHLRKPVVFHRIGIAGSGGRASQHKENGGGPDWLRNDWEPIICISRPGKLPWADGTACGHPPKWAPGGEMSYRLSDGARVNQWGHSIDTGGTVTDKGGVVRSKVKRPSHKEHTKRMPNGDMARQGYNAPVIANPGNAIERTYTAKEVAELLDEMHNFLSLKVGGGQMGHPLAHENEAPFPIELPRFFIKSFCPPDGVVCDPFSGSGTTCQAATEAGRRFIGADLRESQVELCRRRMAGVTPGLFAA